MDMTMSMFRSISVFRYMFMSMSMSVPVSMFMPALSDQGSYSCLNFATLISINNFQDIDLDRVIDMYTNTDIDSETVTLSLTLTLTRMLTRLGHRHAKIY